MFLANALDRDAIVSQLCAVVMPPVFLCVVLLHFFGAKLAIHLLRKDSYNERRVKVRAYGVLRMICIGIFLLFIVFYFSFYKVWDIAMLFVVVLSGYTWIKLRTFSARLDYTYRHVIFCTGKRQETFLWKDVTQMSWETPRGAIAFSLKIQFSSGLTASLSSNDFVGLTKLKTFYDKGRYKN